MSKKGVLLNVFWMGMERVTTVIGTLAITIYTARYLGPEKIGVINLSLAIVSLLTPLSQLGFNTTLFNRCAKNKKSGICLIESSIIYLISVIPCLIYVVQLGFNIIEITTFILIAISGYFTSLDIFKYYYEATLRSKISSVSSQLGLIVSLLCRFLFVKFGLGLLFFALPYLLNSLIPLD